MGVPQDDVDKKDDGPPSQPPNMPPTHPPSQLQAFNNNASISQPGASGSVDISDLEARFKALDNM